jgi:diphosphomevalonate decarboxylase
MSNLFEDLSFSKCTDSGSIQWKSPSNIAIVKYWGKHGNQLPANANLSFTLSTAETRTKINFGPSASGSLELAFRLSGEREPSFEERIKKYLVVISSYLSFISQLRLDIDSENSFPHSSGIASSASGMSALALCLCSIGEKLGGRPWEKEIFLKRASFLARLGSGSASRSLFPNAAIWGELMGLGSSNEYATPVHDIHPTFLNYRDSILLIHEGAKEVSSSIGHSLMNNSPYKDVRYTKANENVLKLLDILRLGDIEGFIEICEEEALTLHGLMMLSKPPYILMKSETIRAIEIVRDFRKRTGIPVCFTLDAGPNLHILYPNNYYNQVLKLIEEELVPLCENGKWLDDMMGSGPEILRSIL